MTRMDTSLSRVAGGKMLTHTEAFSPSSTIDGVTVVFTSTTEEQKSNVPSTSVRECANYMQYPNTNFNHSSSSLSANCLLGYKILEHLETGSACHYVGLRGLLMPWKQLVRFEVD